jgi:hypothetical protein
MLCLLLFHATLGKNKDLGSRMGAVATVNIKKETFTHKFNKW